MSRWALIIFSLIICVSTVYAKDTSVVISSKYTYLSKDCKWAYAESQLSEGQDNSLVCKGFGKYRIFIYFSTMDSHLTIQRKDSPNDLIFDQSIGGIDEKKGVVEWRMANGKPFAIIVRSRKYSSPEEGRKLLKESLVVRGLEEYSEISGSVNVRNSANANEEARKAADDGFKKK